MSKILEESSRIIGEKLGTDFDFGKNLTGWLETAGRDLLATYQSLTEIRPSDSSIKLLFLYSFYTAIYLLFSTPLPRRAGTTNNWYANHPVLLTGVQVV